MVQKSQGRKTYRTANGKSIDLDLLIQRNELTPAVGNARVNARGDELGAGGKIIRTRDEVLRDYYKNSAGVPSEGARKPVADTQAESQPTAQEIKDFDEDWLEDEEGNFKKKDDK